MVVSAQAARLDGILATAREHGAALTLIDTAPHAESAALAAARAADLVLVPCRPSILDLRAVTASRDIATLAGTPTAALLAAVPARGSLAGEAHDALYAHGFTVAPAFKTVSPSLPPHPAISHCIIQLRCSRSVSGTTIVCSRVV